MDKQKIYWIISIAAAVIIILLIVFSMNSKGTETPPSSDLQGNSLSDNTGSTGYSDSEFAGSSGTADSGPGMGLSGGTAESESRNSIKESLALADYLEEQADAMEDMAEDMEIIPSGSASLDFLKGMIPHHEAAIEMAEAYLECGGSHPDLKELAQDTVRTQREEIVLMNQLINTVKDSGEKDEAKEQKYLNAYSQIRSGYQHMSHGLSTAQDIDQAFAEGMRMHHQIAVDMSKAILEHGSNDEVLQLAEDIIDVQEDEIKIMDDILALYH